MNNLGEKKLKLDFLLDINPFGLIKSYIFVFKVYLVNILITFLISIQQQITIYSISKKVNINTTWPIQF